MLDRQIGSARLFQLLALVFPFIFLSSPILVLLAQHGYRLAAILGFSLDMILWATGNSKQLTSERRFTLLKMAMFSVAYSCGTMLVVSAAHSAQDLGSLNGIVQSSAAGGTSSNQIRYHASDLLPLTSPRLFASNCNGIVCTVRRQTLAFRPAVVGFPGRCIMLYGTSGWFIATTKRNTSGKGRVEAT